MKSTDGIPSGCNERQLKATVDRKRGQWNKVYELENRGFCSNKA